MNILELQEDLQNFIGRKITQTELGTAMGNLKRQTVNTRIKNNSEVTVSELLNAQEYLNANIYLRSDDKNLRHVLNSGERQNDTTVDEKSSQFGKRLSELQAQHNFLDREMALLLKISENEYLKLLVGKRQPDLQVLNCIKQNFKVSVDYLLYGD